MELHIGKVWNETVLVQEGKSSYNSEIVPVVIHHGVYTETDFLIILVIIICYLLIIYMGYIVYKENKEMRTKCITQQKNTLNKKY